MKDVLKRNKLVIYIAIFITIILIPIASNATDITKESEILLDNKAISSNVKDNKESTYITVSNGSNIQIKANENIHGIYIVYELSSKEGILMTNEKIIEIGENGFLHEYININEKIGKTKDITISYKETVKIADIYVFDSGELPDYVEVWDKPREVADLLLFSTHSDDEHLFFLGLIPTYVAKGAYVQVVYFTNHNDTPSRLHEQLHGLYTVGIRNYPVIGDVPDAYSTTLEGAIQNLKKANLTEDDVTKFQVEMIRRFKPQVVVGHDEKGEYSHGQHILNTYLLEKAIFYANDKTYEDESYQKYGTWQISKLYLHLYKENGIIMDYDSPLEYFGGKTAYEVSKEGYKKHLSQQWTWFTRWVNGTSNTYTKATDITTYSPLFFGLYFTNVGEDVRKNDMLENITYYKEQIKQKELEEKASQEEKERKEQEEKQNAEQINNDKFIEIFVILGIAILVIILRINAIKKKKSEKRQNKRRIKKS